MKWGMRINTEKTKILSIGAEKANILIACCVLENVSELLLYFFAHLAAGLLLEHFGSMCLCTV